MTLQESQDQDQFLWRLHQGNQDLSQMMDPTSQDQDLDLCQLTAQIDQDQCQELPQENQDPIPDQVQEHHQQNQNLTQDQFQEYPREDQDQALGLSQDLNLEQFQVPDQNQVGCYLNTYLTFYKSISLYFRLSSTKKSPTKNT